MAEQHGEQALEARIEWQVGGMDCGSCAAKVRGAAERVPGVSQVEVSTMSERLSLLLQPGQGTPGDVERAVKAIGYDIAPLAAPEDPQDTPKVTPEPSWHASSKGRLLIGTGALLAMAWAVDLTLGGATARWAFGLATVLGLIPIASKAVAMARARMPFTIEMLMTIAALGALLIGAEGEAALVVFLFALGETLEGIAAGRARGSIRALADLVPTEARLIEGGAIRTVAAAKLQPGQVVQVRPGDRVPADGTVSSGTSGVDESPVTGESVPRLKAPGDAVFAGSINSDGALQVTVSRAAADNTIARIVRLVQEAESARAPTERFIDRFSRWYMPAIVAVAVAVALLPPLVAGGDWQTWLYRGLALLLIGCPCALVISVPAAVASALSAGARAGLLMKGGVVVEAAAQTTRVAFDKTGTLTEGRPQVTDVVVLDGSEDALLSSAAAVERDASHPLAQAIVARAEGRDLPDARDAGAIPGRGAFAHIGGRRVTVGAPFLAREAGLLSDTVQAQITALEDDGKTVVTVFDQIRLMGLLALRDEPRSDAAQAIRDLRAMGVEAVMLTGDNPGTARAIAGSLGIDYRAGLMPEDKVAALRQLTEHDKVLMVGDGINDAPALAAAHLGVAMGSGTDVALETADGALMRNRVGDVVALVQLARAAMANIRQNVAIALGLKAVFLVTTVLGVTGLWIAILADTGATVLVTLNALRLLRHKAGAGAGRAGPEGPPVRAGSGVPGNIPSA